ncbi:hypothetical protein AAG570_012082 [Ranatra chinensis]|uniref:Laminin G domain-containing protein n=1 Tax=Ranatra chinensis TaxID=642074 RepID=A0ABD0YHS9_9HEMI
MTVTWEISKDPATSDSLKNEQIAPGSSIILNLDKNAKLFIGGLPPSFPVSDYQEYGILNYGSFIGAIEDVIIGGISLGLWNFLKQSNVKAVRERDELLPIITTTGFRFSGDGYVELDRQPYRMDIKSYVSLQFKTKSKEGLIFLLGNESNFLSVELREGRILYQLDLGGGVLTLASDKPYNDDEWHSLEAGRDKKRAILKVDGTLVQDGTTTGSNDRLTPSKDLYIGGHPDDHGIIDVSTINFDGCIDQVRISDTSVDLNKNKKAYGVIPGCPEKVMSHIMQDLLGENFCTSLYRQILLSEGLNILKISNYQKVAVISRFACHKQPTSIGINTIESKITETPRTLGYSLINTLISSYVSLTDILPHA